MIQERLDKSAKVVVPIVILLFVGALAEAFMTSNEFGLANLILRRLSIPIVILSIGMSAYWVLLMDDFWLIYEGSHTGLWTKIKTGLKFLVWIPAMALYFFALTQGVLSLYNRTMGEQRPITIIGEIVDKDTEQSNGTNRYYFEISDQALGRKVEIRVNESEYERYNTGDNYQTERKIGALGIIYELR